MTHVLKDELARLPSFFAESAKEMMLRMLAAMQRQLEGDLKTANVSYLALLLKISQTELATEFEKVLKLVMGQATFTADKVPAGLSLELEMVGDAPAEVSMRESDDAFGKLKAKARSVGLLSLDAFGAKTLLECVQTAMEKARISHADAQALTPFVRHALNLELLAIYEKFNKS